MGDIFVVVRNEDHLNQLTARMQSSSVLSFTYEKISVNGKIPFTRCQHKNTTWIIIRL